MKLLSIINSGDYVNPLSDPNTIIAQAKEVSYHRIICPSSSCCAIGAGQNVYNQISPAGAKQMERSNNGTTS